MFEINNFMTAGKFFLIIAGELIVIFIAVAFIVGLLLEYLPPSHIRAFLAGRMLGVQYFLGAGLGAITPFCSCSTVPTLTVFVVAVASGYIVDLMDITPIISGTAGGM